jgi:hypothetical protein
MRRGEFLLKVIECFLPVPDRIDRKVQFSDCLQSDLLVDVTVNPS